VHVDGSSLSLKKNIKLTKKIVNMVKDKETIVEGEVGHIPGGSEVHKERLFLDKKEYTDPQVALEFVNKTGVDSLAILIGNVHGIYQKMPEIDHDRLVSIRKTVKQYLVFHGGSGFSEEEIEKVIKEGIVKININTELRVAWKEATWKAINNNRNEFKPYKILEGVPEKVAEVVASKIKLFRSQNKV
ncbi:MAG: class II fructose-bisphosphate aldolase, partial [bacterium]